MKVVVAVDSLKGSLTSMGAGYAVKAGIHKVHPDAEVIVKPLADGGEGTTDALIEGMGGERILLSVTGPLGKPVQAYYGYLKKTKTAIIEMAAAAGITLISKAERNPLEATSFGVGQMIMDAIQRGCRNFIIGIGGSATNDGGVGMLQALGFSFTDRNGMEVCRGAKSLSSIESIRSENACKELSCCHFQIACDVTNPLCGEHGATYIYGPQKGVTEDMREALDRDMAHYAQITENTVAHHCQDKEGAGAAGGLGFAFLSFLHADLTPGIDLILRAINLEEALINADFAVTGEGRLDYQTAMGKAPVGVAKLAKKHNVKVIAFAGGVTKEAHFCNDAGIDAFFPIVRGITTLEEAMNPQNARENMTDSVEQVFRLL